LKAIDGGAKAYVHSLGEALHYEFKSRGVHVTVVPPAPTNTPVLAKFGFDTRTMPMKPMTVEQCVSEGLTALRENRSRISKRSGGYAAFLRFTEGADSDIGSKEGGG
jgi:uncharacterized protein